MRLMNLIILCYSFATPWMNKLSKLNIQNFQHITTLKANSDNGVHLLHFFFFNQWPFPSMSVTLWLHFCPSGIKKDIGFSTSRHHTWYGISCVRRAVSMVQEQSRTESGYKLKSRKTKRMEKEWARLDELPEIALKLLGSARGGSCGAQNGES